MTQPMFEEKMILQFVPLTEIRRIRKNVKDPFQLCKILSNIFRINTLYMITRAGSGHIGTSFSSLDIVTWLWTQLLKFPNENKKDSDTYFSSKGHDVPGLYSVLIGLEKIDFGYIHKLRRLGGLDGHPDVKTPYMITNTGPLGMGISKARGMAIANRLRGKKGHFYVLTGDGELQEGQIWESLQPTTNGNFGEITIIVDHNKMQSDTWIRDVSDLGDLEAKFRAFGWVVARTDGHNIKAFAKALNILSKTKNRPKVLIADTIKGKGVSFMEKTDKNGLYKYHAGAPSSEEYQKALDELVNKVNSNLQIIHIDPLTLERASVPVKSKSTRAQRFSEVYGDELVRIAKKRKDVIAIDCDLVKSCGLIPFKNTFPNRFVECGIAEQDAVSLAGGLALKGFLPVVHSLACFISTRPNEQIYNNATELKKIIYFGSQAGLLPAGPGHSHQSVRDISALGSVPDLVIFEPSNESETRLAINWAINKNKKSTYLRLSSVQMEILYKLPKSYQLSEGSGVFLKNGRRAAIISYGPVMLTQAVIGAEILKRNRIEVAVVNLPWLNRIDVAWFKKSLGKYKIIFTLDDHYIQMGQGEMIARTVAQNQDIKTKVVLMGIETIPACGANDEVLKYHSLDGASLAKKIKTYF